MATAVTSRVDWSLLWQQRGFRYFFAAMFVSLFGSGMNFIGVSWYIMSATHSTVAVSWQVIVVTLPGLVVPFLGGVLIDRMDRRYLGVLLDLSRGLAVLAAAYIAWRGHLHIWHLYAMTLLTGTGSAVYWSNVNALVQEVVPPSQFTGANASVLVGVQSGMLLAGTFVGFFYDNMGIGAIAGGLITSQLPQRVRLPLYVAVMAALALGHVAVPFVTFLLGAAILQGCFGFFRALGGIVAQSSLMSIVPRHFIGRTQSAFAIIATILQLAISFSLGLLAQRFSIATGFFLLALMYAGATLSASRARALLARRDFSPTGHPEAIRQG